ncbi:MAG: hypothetical protein CVT49_04485 [candidate division Zixibacteria bacterium HGW-Zixibacteria-1]|nr:MAG: hypothetical protein CVT49_04485 [candidate division Zixibacteria bacterium HGW-Zixibacteria-1]
MEKDQLLPGDSLDLEIIFSSKAYYGMVTKSPAIYTNEPDSLMPQKIRRIVLTANVYRSLDTTYPINIMPHLFNITTPVNETDDTIPFQIKNFSRNRVYINIVDYPRDFLKLRMPDRIGAGQTATGFISLTPLGLTSEFRKSITIELNGPGRTRFTIPVTRVLPDRTP